MVCCRAGRSRIVPADSAWSSRASRAAGSRDRVPAAASSRARGSPATRRQIAAMDATLSVVTAKPGDAACARSTNSRADGKSVRSAAVGGVRAGRGSGGTGSSCSPRRRSGARLVLSTNSCGQDWIRSATWGAAPSRCSTLSSTSRRCLSRRWARTASLALVARSCRPSVVAMLAATRAGSLTGAKATIAAPSRNEPAARPAASIASRVFPVPPTPVSVTSRTSPRSRMSSSLSRSASRPISGVSGTAGRNAGAASRVAGPAGDAMRAGSAAAVPVGAAVSG
jgi:hypothetical protein